MSPVRRLSIEAGAGHWTADALDKHATLLLECGRAFWGAAQRTGSPIVRAYLIGHSLEIFLKVYLLRTGMKSSVLRRKKYGHHLDVLLAEAERRRLSNAVTVSPKLQQDIREFGVVYSSKGFEYFDLLFLLSPPAIPSLGPIRRFVGRLAKVL